jgi:hypothetical protein
VIALLITLMSCVTLIFCISAIVWLFYQPVRIQKRRVDAEISRLNDEHAFELYKKRELHMLNVQDQYLSSRELGSSL